MCKYRTPHSISSRRRWPPAREKLGSERSISWPQLHPWNASRQRTTYASMTAALLLGVLTGILAGPLTSSQQYTVASKTDAVTVGTFALVGLQAATPAATLSAFLAENNFVIVDGPRTGGIYRVRVSDKALNGEAADAARAKLKARADLFSFVSAAPAAN